MWDHSGAEPGKTWACRPSCSNAKLILCSLGQYTFVNWALPCLASIRQEPFAPYGNGKPRLSRFSFKHGLGHKRISCIRQSFQQENIWKNVRMEAVFTPNCIPTLVVKVWIQMVLLQNAQAWQKSCGCSFSLFFLSNFSTRLLFHFLFYFLLSPLSCFTLCFLLVPLFSFPSFLQLLFSSWPLFIFLLQLSISPIISFLCLLLSFHPIGYSLIIKWS